MRCYGHPFIDTPHLDALAADSARFTQVVSAAPTTLASHVAIMTGTYAHTHGVPRNGFSIGPDNVMLARILRQAGFRTAAFVSSFALHSQFGFAQGFETFDENFDLRASQDRGEQDQRRADRVTDAAIRYLERTDADHLFLFVHYFDAHAPFDPPPPFDTRYPRKDIPVAHTLREGIDPAIDLHHTQVVGAALGRNRTTDAGLTTDLLRKVDGLPLGDDQALDALYCGEISFVDDHIGRLLDCLKKRGIYDQTLIVVVADHGETMWEHGDYWNHGLWVYDTTVRVPLLVRIPGPDHSTRSIDDVVSTVDITPTLLDLLGLSLPPRLDGVSLTPLLSGQTLSRGPVFSEATQPYRVERGQRWANALKPKCIRAGRWKYIHAAYLELEELYDIAADPEERVNLLAGPSLPESAPLAELRAALGEWAAAANPLDSRFNPRGDEQTVQKLRNLGYVGGPEGQPR